MNKWNYYRRADEKSSFLHSCNLIIIIMIIMITMIILIVLRYQCRMIILQVAC